MRSGGIFHFDTGAQGGRIGQRVFTRFTRHQRRARATLGLEAFMRRQLCRQLRGLQCRSFLLAPDFSCQRGFHRTTRRRLAFKASRQRDRSGLFNTTPGFDFLAQSRFAGAAFFCQRSEFTRCSSPLTRLRGGLLFGFFGNL